MWCLGHPLELSASNSGQERKMDPNSANNSGEALMLRPMAVELGSPSMWPDHMVGQPDNPVRVLLVDDDAHLRMVIAQEIMNDRRTMVVAQADNIKDARKAIRQHEFDVMLLDLKLGADNGLELIEVMKSHRPQAEVIVVSVVETEEQVLHAFELGGHRLSGQELLVWQLPPGSAAGRQRRSLHHPQSGQASAAAVRQATGFRSRSGLRHVRQAVQP